MQFGHVLAVSEWPEPCDALQYSPTFNDKADRMKFEAYSRRQAQVLFDAISRHVASATKTELDSLRAGVEARITALQESISHPEHAHLLDQLVQELSTAARGEADAARGEAEKAAAQALADTRHAADAALAAAQADAQGKIAAELKTNAALRAAVDEARKQVKHLQEEHAGAQATLQAAQAAAQAAQTAAQGELERTRHELEGRLEQVQAGRAELARVLAEAQRDAVAARGEVVTVQTELEAAHAEVAAQVTAVKNSQARLLALEHESTEILLERDEMVARLDAEGRRASELDEALTAARREIGMAKQEASLAKVDAEGRRQGLEAATERIRLLEEELRKKNEAIARERPRQAVAAAGTAADRGDSGVLLLEHVATALESIDVAISASEILETLIEQLGRHFARAAVFLVGPSSFKGWRGTGLGPGADISNIEIPRTIDSLLSRTLTDRKPATVAGNIGDPVVGVLGSPAATALALPVFANGRVIALAYAEHDEESSASLAAGCKIAEILIDHANRRLTVKRRSGSQDVTGGHEVDKLGAGMNLEARPATYAPARQARRLTLPNGLEITLEGVASELVDLSHARRPGPVSGRDASEARRANRLTRRARRARLQRARRLGAVRAACRRRSALSRWCEIHRSGYPGDRSLPGQPRNGRPRPLGQARRVGLIERLKVSTAGRRERDPQGTRSTTPTES